MQIMLFDLRTCSSCVLRNSDHPPAPLSAFERCLCIESSFSYPTLVVLLFSITARSVINTRPPFCEPGLLMNCLKHLSQSTVVSAAANTGSVKGKRTMRRLSYVHFQSVFRQSHMYILFLLSCVLWSGNSLNVWVSASYCPTSHDSR